MSKHDQTFELSHTDVWLDLSVDRIRAAWSDFYVADGCIRTFSNCAFSVDVRWNLHKVENQSDRSCCALVAVVVNRLFAAIHWLLNDVDAKAARRLQNNQYFIDLSGARRSSCGTFCAAIFFC